MFEELKDNLKNSYSPYSNFKVSAIIVMDNGNKYSGVNVEVASFGGSICAERVAITKAVSSGEDLKTAKEIHILGSSNKITYPCFICRQSFVEFFPSDIEIFVYNLNGDRKKHSMDELCPYPFSEEDLK